MAHARATGTTVVTLFAQIIEEYAAGTTERVPNAVPVSDRTMTKVPVDAAVHRKASARARAEKRSLSALLTEAFDGKS